MSLECNSMTIGDFQVTEVECDGKKYQVEYYLGAREGATEGMQKSTQRNFKVAIMQAARGEPTPPPDFKEEISGSLPAHGESRIVLWVKDPGIPVLLEHGMRFIKVNVFNEFTAVTSWLGLLNMYISTQEEIYRTKMVLPKVATRSFEKAVGAPSESVMPSPHVPAPAARQAPVQPAQNTSVAAPANSGDVTQIEYDYKQHDQISAEHMGKSVEVQVEKIAYEMCLKKDKSGTYEQIRPYTKAHYETPIYNLSDFPGGDWGNGKEYQRLFPMLVKAGDFVEGRFGLVFKISTGKKDGKVYWNLKDAIVYDIDDDGASRVRHDAEQAPDFEPHPGDEIPW